MRVRGVVGAMVCVAGVLGGSGTGVGAQANDFVASEPNTRGVSEFERDELLLDCDLTGTEGDDVLRPEPGQVTCALGGDDVIFGTPGIDYVLAGPGDDVVYGGEGDDLVLVGQGDDVAYGGEGNDRLMVSAFDERFDGGSNRFVGGPGDDELAGGISSNVDPDQFYLPLDSAGSSFYGGPGVDRIVGSNGDDRIYVGGASGFAAGGLGDDFIVGGNGATGGLASQWCVSRTDALRVVDSEFAIVDVNQNVAFAANVLDGGPGDDTIVSGGGLSCIRGATGSDVIYGSDYADSILAGGDFRTPGRTPTPGGDPADRDRVFAKGGDDVVYGSAGSDTVYTGSGDDVFIDDRRINRFETLPDDQLQGDLVRTGPGDDVLRGSDGDDRLNGGEGTDRILGGGGNDTLWPGNDSAPDTLDGQAGNDRCTAFVADDVTCEHVMTRDSSLS